MPDLPTDSAKLLKFLDGTHPWYDRMCQPEEWPRLRAIQGQITTAAEKTPFLHQAPFEKDNHYKVRVQISEFLGATAGIVERFVAAIFERDAAIEFEGQERVQEWSQDVDDRGTTLQEYVEDLAPEAAMMGRVGVALDVPAAPEGSETPTNRAQARAAGTDRLVPSTFATEEIRNWSLDDRTGEPLWVIVRRDLTRQGAFDASREHVRRWTVMTTTEVITYEASIDPKKSAAAAIVPHSNDPLGQDSKRGDVLSGSGGAAQEVRPEQVGSAAHELGRVPIELFYGKRRKTDPWGQGESIVKAAARADVAAFQEDSWNTFARFIHNVPAPIIKSSKTFAQIVRDGSAVHLNPDEGEDFYYTSTPADAFEVGMRAVRDRKSEATRLAGADTSHLDEEGHQVESGRARGMRFVSGEARVLARFAKSVEAAHHGILELAAGLLLDDRFEGSVEYSRHFDLARGDELIETYEAADRIGLGEDSPTWDASMRLRIARTTRGDAPAAELQQIDEEFEEAAKQRRENPDEARREQSPEPVIAEDGEQVLQEQT